MKIVTGLFDHMVLQRNRQGVSRAEFSGTCAGAGRIEARVAGRFGWRAVGRAARGRFQGVLPGLRTGGPYDVELRLRTSAGATESLRARDVLVGDVWMLGGQSNMEGIGLVRDAAKPHPHVRAFYMHDEWKVARDPIHNLDEAVDAVHGRIQRATHVGAGPGVAFGQEMRRRTGVPQGLIACAHGGTTMDQWDPKLKTQGGASLYGALLRRFRKNGSRVAGVAWYQGCSDVGEREAPLYAAKMKTLIRSLRRDLRDADLPWVIVQIGRVYNQDGTDPTGWIRVQDAQRRLPEAVRRCAVVPAIDLPMDDRIHISGAGQQRLGRRMAQAMAQLIGVKGAGKPPLRLKSVRIERDRLQQTANVVVEFGNVMGRLTSAGRPHGFDLGDPQPRNRVHDVRLEGNRAILRTSLSAVLPQGMCLYYGYGFAPYCNLTDSADRAVPVLGPVPLDVPCAVAPYIQSVCVSRLLPGQGKLHGLQCPLTLSKLGFARRKFDGDFWDIHAELGARAPEDLLVYFACTLECSEPMKLGALFGYDGPVKLWVDRKELFHDPNGTNPAIPDQRRLPVKLKAGRHKVLVALGSNLGRAWGCFLRFERTDVTARQIRQGPEAYAMPVVHGEKP